MIANELEYLQALLDELRRIDIKPVTFNIDLTRGRIEDRDDGQQSQQLSDH